VRKLTEQTTNTTDLENEIVKESMVSNMKSTAIFRSSFGTPQHDRRSKKKGKIENGG